jgi:carbamoyl-phosphate synthase small subunit
MITSQNHGFAVDEATLPDNVRATHRSLFDGTLQGIARTDCPAFSSRATPRRARAARRGAAVRPIHRHDGEGEE